MTMRRHLLPVLIVAVLFASIAEASHFHRDDHGQREDTHVQCLLCLHSAGSAGTPHVAAVLRSVAIVLTGHCPAASIPFKNIDTASYDARGPPHV